MKRRTVLPRWLLVAGGVVLAGVLGGVWFYPQFDAAAHWRQAQTALDEYDFATTRTHLERCLAAWPDDGDVHLLLAQVCRRQGDGAAAERHLKRAQQGQVERRRLEREELLLQAQTGALQPIEAVLLEHLATAAPADEKNLREGLALGYLQVGRYEDAYRITGPWTERFPNDWQAQFLHGQALEQGLRRDLAEQAYQAVLQRKPDHVGAHLRLGQVLLFRKRYPEALPHFEACLRANSDDAAALLGLAQCQRSLSPTDVTRATLDRLLAVDDGNAAALVLRAQVELDDAKPEQALPWLRRAVAAAPYDPDANQTLATVLRLLGKGDEARGYEARKQEVDRAYRRLEDLTKAKTRSPRDVALYLEGGKLLAGMGHYDEAVRWLVGGLLADPRHPETRRLLAECIPKLGDPKLVDAYRPLLESLPRPK